MRILIVGAGAVGGYFGGRLAAAGRDVSFLVRTARAGQLRREGLRIVSPHGDLTVEPVVVERAGITAPYDLVLLGVKGHALDRAMEDFAPAVGPETMILPVLNGMQHMDRLTLRFGRAPVLGGVCLVASELDDDGRIVQLAEFQSLIYGERSGEVTLRVQTLDAALQGAGFEAELSTGIMQAMWEKWVQLASLGAVTCLLGGPVGEIAAVPHGPETARAIIDEAAQIAAAHWHAPSPGFRERVAAMLTASGSPMTSSLYRDMQKGAEVEVDAIIGDLIERGAAKNIESPLLKAAFVRLKVYQAVRGGAVPDGTASSPG